MEGPRSMKSLATLILCFSLGVCEVSGCAAQDGAVIKDVVALDRYRKISRKEENKRLDNFAEALKRNSTERGYIIVYAGRPSGLKMARVHARRALDYLVQNGSDPHRMVSIALDSSEVNEPTVELWVLPPEAAEVIPIPGFQLHELRSKKVFTIKGTDLNNRKRSRSK